MNSHLSSLGAAFANHLWQSTAFALVVWALTWMLRKNHARVRYALWLAASAKFLVPLSLLIWVVNLGAGNLWPPAPRQVVPIVYSTVNFVETPFTENLPLSSALVHSPTMWERYGEILPISLGILWALGAGIVLVVWWNRWRAASALLRKTTSAVEGRELAILRRLEARFQKQMPRNFLPLRLSAERMEPAVFGLFRPALVWPRQLSRRLDDEQIEAILAHEWMHVRRRDNLTAALHMLVEAIFWFHPLVWWMDRQLIKEREQACDEAVIGMGGDVETYAESLLQTCRFCIESRLPCVAGVTGAELKERVTGILSARVLMRMTWPKKLLLGAVGILLLAVPIVAGAVWAQTGQTEDTSAPESKNLKFAVVSIRQSKSGGSQNWGEATPDGYEMRNMFLMAPILTAYPPTGGASAYDRVIGGADWLGNDWNYNIDAKVDPADLADWQNPKKQPAMLRAMLQAMLADRMKLKVHRITKEGPVYALAVGGKGSRLKETDPNDPHPGAYPMPGGGKISRPEVKDGWTTAHYFGISIAQLISFGVLPQLGRPIEDRTGLTGKYDMTIVKQAPPHAGTPEVGPAPETSAADIANQLGLKLEKAPGSVETLVIDHIEKPSEN